MLTAPGMCASSYSLLGRTSSTNGLLFSHCSWAASTSTVRSALARTFSTIVASSGLRAGALLPAVRLGRCLTTDEAYLNEESGKITTTILPGSSGTISKAPASAMAELGPAVMLSSRFNRRQSSKAVWFVTSIRRSYSSGRNSWVCCNWRKLRTPGISCPSFGWTPSTWISARCSLRKRPVR